MTTIANSLQTLDSTTLSHVTGGLTTLSLGEWLNMSEKCPEVVAGARANNGAVASEQGNVRVVDPNLILSCGAERAARVLKQR